VDLTIRSIYDILAAPLVMPKRTAALELSLPEREPDTPAYHWLYSALRAGVLEGRLRPGARLPSTRDLARQYGLARGTVVNAFELLMSEGYISGSVGSGTYVSKVLPEEFLEAKRPEDAKARAQRMPRRCVSSAARRTTLFTGFEQKPSRAFRPNVPALDKFPTTLWAQIAARRVRRAPVSLLLGCDPMGYKPLREAVAHYLTTSRGVNCEAEQIAIISGVQEALEMTARVLLDPGDRVCMEEPGYIGAGFVFDAFGATVLPRALDIEGITIDEKKMRGAKLIYATPAHQFPLGITMSLPRRLNLLDWAARTGALIFEDDYDSEFRFSGRPVPALQGLDRNGVVLFAGSFNKALFPSLRLGYLVIPPDLVSYFEANQSLARRHAPLLDQAIVCDFITEGHFGRHVRRMREIYAERHSVLLDCARESLEGLLEVSTVEAGLQTVGWLKKGIRAERAAKAAAMQNVEVTPIGRFARGQVRREGLQLGFAAVDASEIRRGVRELGLVLQGLARTP